MPARIPRTPDDIGRFDPNSVTYSALTEPVSAFEVREFKQEVATSSPFPYPSAVTPVLRSLLTVTGILGLIAAVIAAGSAITGLAGGSPNAAVASLGAPITILVTAGIVGWMVWLIIKAWDVSDRWKRWLRLHSFGMQNGLLFMPTSPRPKLSAAAFAGAGVVTDRFVSVHGQRFEIGNVGGSVPWGYIAIGLERNLPHMILASRYNQRRFQSRSAVVRPSQVLSLEGDFDKYFTLFAPEQYQRDALYVFSPDLMALMIDEVAVFEVEIVDNWMFFYSLKPFDLASRRTMRRLIRIARVVGTKTFRQTDRYRDERTALPFEANVVAAPGRRLRTRVSILTAIGVAVWVTFLMLRFMHIA